MAGAVEGAVEGMRGGSGLNLDFAEVGGEDDGAAGGAPGEAAEEEAVAAALREITKTK